ncbi:MAG: SRPBCC family protein [Candidatus Dormibacteraeota bacterium]|nr:SRPBCC family protein [Candidatus Dormibacteraeota bacterium]
MAAQYHFKTEWEFKADLPRTWSVVLDLQHYPACWRNFRSVQLLRGDGQSVGSLFECVVRGSLPYSLRYTMEVMTAERHRAISLRSSGDLVGTGRWEFTEVAPQRCRATYAWNVATTNPVLNLVAPVAGRFLAQNHEQVMANGYRALRPRVEA